MRRLIAPLGFIGLISLAPLASAMSAPMSEEELTAAADLIAHGHISEVLCQGEPVYDGQSTTTAYHAILTLDAVTKPEDSDLTSVTLPFATVVWDEDQPPAMCGWTPSYQLGERGLYYLATGAATELYTLVSWNAFVADDDSAGEELPSCEEPEPEPDTTASEDVSESTEDTSEVGPEDDATAAPDEDATEPPAEDVGAGPPAPDSQVSPPGPDIVDVDECEDDDDCDSGSGVCQDGACWYPPSEPICTEDSDCADGKECVWIDSVTSDCVSAGGDNPEEPVSGESGGGGSGGCASGGSQLPLSAALLVLGLVAFTSRRRTPAARVSI